MSGSLGRAGTYTLFVANDGPNDESLTSRQVEPYAGSRRVRPRHSGQGIDECRKSPGL